MTDWRYAIDLTYLWGCAADDPHLNMREWAPKVVRQIEAAECYDLFCTGALDDALLAVLASETEEEFDAEMSGVYDWADRHGIWIETQSHASYQRIAAKSLLPILRSTA